MLIIGYQNNIKVEIFFLGGGVESFKNHYSPEVLIQ